MWPSAYHCTIFLFLNIYLAILKADFQERELMRDRQESKIDEKISHLPVHVPDGWASLKPKGRSIHMDAGAQGAWPASVLSQVCYQGAESKVEQLDSN